MFECKVFPMENVFSLINIGQDKKLFSIEKRKLYHTLYHYMVSDLALLHKIFKDDTNQKILALISETNSLSYADLMEKTEIYSESLLNYHLKVLGELLIKNKENQYLLTEKGQAALKLLDENPDQLRNFGRKKLKQNGAYLVLGYVTTIIIIVFCYFQGHIDIRMLRRIVCSISVILVFYVGYIVRFTSQTSERVKEKSVLFNKIFCIIAGGIAGPMVALVGILIATVCSVYVGGPNFLQVTNDNIAFIFSFFSIAVVIGCLTGYCIGKKLVKTKV